MSNPPSSPAPAKPLTKVQSYLVHGLQALLGLLGALLAIASQVTALPLPPDLTKYWGAIIGAAVAVKPIVLILGDLFDDGVINQSFGRAAVVALFLFVAPAACLNTNTGDAVKNAHNTAINRTLDDAGAVLGKTLVSGLFSVAASEATGSKVNYQQAGAQAIQANIDVISTASELKGIYGDWTAGNAPKTGKAAADVIGSNVTPAKLQAVANVIFAATGAPPAK